MRNGFETEIPVYDYVNHIKVPISIKKEHWNKGYITGGNYHIPLRDLNNLLAKVKADVKLAVNISIENKLQINRDSLIRLTYINELNALENERKIASGEIEVDEQSGAFASQDEYIEFVIQSQDPKYISLKKELGYFSKQYILDYWDDFISESADSYNTPLYIIQEYIKDTEDNCKATEFSCEWLERFFKYIIKEGYSYRKDGQNKKPYKISTNILK
jgi:hypothetical protein